MPLPDHYNHPLTPKLHIPLVRVRAGTYIRGSEAGDAYGDEKPEHRVHISKDFYIGQFPITLRIWQAVMEDHNPSRFVGEDRPVEQVSWQDIVTGGQDEEVSESFLDRLHYLFPVKEEGLVDFQFRLPTEAEWEYAAKGGHLARPVPEEKVLAEALYTPYAGSDQLKKVAWYDRNSHSETKAVGQKVPNELGLHDLCGNVWEWCTDWFDARAYERCAKNGLTIDPKGPKEGRNRVLRGGSWNSDPQSCRVSCRLFLGPSSRNDSIGFRLVLAPR